MMLAPYFSWASTHTDIRLVVFVSLIVLATACLVLEILVVDEAEEE